MKRLVALCLLLAAVGAMPARADSNCKDSSPTNVSSTDGIVGRSGKYVKPAEEPHSLVVFAHGYGHRSDSWIAHMRNASEHGALAVTMDYTGIGPAPDNRGWNVSAGADDMILAAKAFLARCESIKNVVLFGVSMGGNASGLALAQNPRRADGSPLFDYWFNIEGAANVIETYTEASAVAPALADGAEAKADIEAEMGGTIVDVPERYIESAIVARVPDIKASGVKGVVMSHGLDDGLVPYNQSRELVTLLRAAQIPTEMTTVVRKGSGEAGTTITGYTSAAGAPYTSPFAGHGTESSTTHTVLNVGHFRLWALLDSFGTSTVAAPVDRETILDDAGELETP